MKQEQQLLFKIRDLRQKTQFKIDDIYIDKYAKVCKPIATAIYNSLCRHAKFNTQKAFPSQSLIAHQHNISTKTVSRAIKKLAEYNIISIQRERQKGKFDRYIYTLLDKSEWIKLDNKPFKEVKPKLNKCLLCGISIIDNCHIVPRSEGGRLTKDNMIFLCPTHHRMFDRGLLNKNQLDKIKNYTSGQKQPMVKQSSPADKYTSRQKTTMVERDTKDNKKLKDNKDIYKDNKKEEGNAKALQTDGAILNKLLEGFKKVNPSYSRLYGNNTQRKALDRLAVQWGVEHLTKIIDFIETPFGIKFAPTITTPLELETKMGKLISWSKTYKQNNKGKGIIV